MQLFETLSVISLQCKIGIWQTEMINASVQKLLITGLFRFQSDVITWKKHASQFSRYLHFQKTAKSDSLDPIQTSGLQFDYNPVLSWSEAVQSGVMGGANKLLGSRYLRGPLMSTNSWGMKNNTTYLRHSHIRIVLFIPSDDLKPQRVKTAE